MEKGERANAAKTRVVHCQRELFDHYIGRSMPRCPELRATGWDNPFQPAPGEPDAAGAVQRYRVWVMERPQLLARLPELRGKTLGCWRPPLGGLYGDLDGRICHGQALAGLADALPDALPDVGAVEEQPGEQKVMRHDSTPYGHEDRPNLDQRSRLGRSTSLFDRQTDGPLQSKPLLISNVCHARRLPIGRSPRR